jgi:hypothetical protein
MLSACHNAVSVSFAGALLEKADHQLDDKMNLRLMEDNEEPIRRQAISLTRYDADCLYLLKMLHSLLYQGSMDKSRVSTNISPVVDFPHALSMAKFNDILKCKKAKVAKRSALLVDLTGLSDSIQQVPKERTCIVGKGLIQDHYISTGINDDPLFSSMNDYDIALSYSAALDQGNGNTSSDTDDSYDRLTFYEDKEKQSQPYLQELLAIQTSDSTRNKDSTNPVSLVESIATTAKDNLSVMKLDVDKSLGDVRSSEMHLLNYNDFIEKKKMQLVQCLRDLQEHCCTCKGPHITKPPFSQGKEYRREPTHTKTQKNKCDFLRRKRRELKWLDETLAKYDNNQERFKRELADRQDEIRRKKVIMKDALANSLRLMDMV